MSNGDDGSESRGPGEPEGAQPSGSHPDQGAEGAELGADYGAEAVEDDEVIDAEVLDGDPNDDTSSTADGTDGPDDVPSDPLALALTQRDEYLDSLRRLQAEFENYRKRVAKQQSDQVARAAMALVDKVLPVLDTLDLATQHVVDAESADGRALVAVSGQLHDVLAKEGLERIDPLGEEFDPNAHEAVGHLPAEETAEGDAGADANGEPVVGQVMRAGYRWGGAVLRPAMVMVRG